MSAGCYTTARWAGVRVALGRRAAERLVRDAAALGLGRVEPERVLRELERLGSYAFGPEQGVVRLDAQRSPAGALELSGSTRPLGPDSVTWSALAARHAGPGAALGAKLAERADVAAARAAAEAAGVEEALLFDDQGLLVEGARTNLIAVLGDGALVTPPLRLGRVRGIALELLREVLPEIREAEVSRRELDGVRELVAVNAVRGAKPIVRLDGVALGQGAAPGPVCTRLAAILRAAA